MIMETNITSRSDSSVTEDKLVEIDAFIEELTNELKTKRANLGLTVPVKNRLIQAALTQSRLEGQVHELRLENKRLNQRIEMATVQLTKQEVESTDSLKVERLEGQLDLMRDENNKLSVEVESLKLDVFKLNVENKKLKEELEAKTLSGEEKAKLQAEIEGLKIANTKIRVENETVKSFANVVAAPTASKATKAIETKLQKVKEANLLFIKPTNNQGTNEVKEAIIRSINPKEDKLKIKGIRKTQNTVIVETATKEDTEKIKQKAAQIQNIKCEESKKRRPTVIIYQVPTSIPDEEFMDQLYSINLSEELTIEEFKQEAALKFKTGRRDSRKANHVLEVSPRLWYSLLQKERVYVEYESLRVKDFVRVPRCFTCHDLGHTSGQCKKKEEVCYRCGKTGHIQSACKNKKEGCIPCSYRKIDCDKAGGPDCPTYKHFHRRVTDNTDYDYIHHGK